MSDHRIPFNKAWFVGTELDHVSAAVEAGHISGDGTFGRRCEQWLEQHFDAPRVLLTTSCTHALEMAARLVDTGPGSEVIVPSFTFVSTANAFALAGASIKFADVEPDTLGIDPASVEALVTDRTTAIVPVHYGGVACDMQALGDLAVEFGLDLIEDNAHGLFATYGGQPLGTFGRLATQSFHETKNVTCGEGGALVINDPALVDRAEILREKGTDRARFFRGEVDRYTWVDIGSSWVQSDLLAAVLWGQLEASTEIQGRRRAVWERYETELADWAADNDVQMPACRSGGTHAYHLFHLVMPDLDSRTRLIKRLGDAGILAVFHYQPLHLSPMGRAHGGQPGQCPVTERIADRIVRLPLFPELGPRDQDDVISAITSARA